jgi:hypothetical protein
MLRGAFRRGSSWGWLVACASLVGCASATTAPPPSLLVGVSQEGGVPLGEDGATLSSAAYLVSRDGRVRMMENYGDKPAERRLSTSPDTARKLIELLSSPAWQELRARPEAAPAEDDVRVTIEIEGKSVTRWSSRQEPIFREVLSRLAEIRRGGG